MKILITALLSYSPIAWAYLDPGTGSILIQGLLAAIAGAAFTLRIYWERVKAFFSRRRDDSSAIKSSDSDEE